MGKTDKEEKDYKAKTNEGRQAGAQLEKNDASGCRCIALVEHHRCMSSRCGQRLGCVTESRLHRAGRRV